MPIPPALVDGYLGYLIRNDYSWPFCVRADRGWRFAPIDASSLSSVGTLGLKSLTAQYPAYPFSALSEEMRTAVATIDTLATETLAAAARGDLPNVQDNYRMLGEIVGRLPRPTPELSTELTLYIQRTSREAWDALQRETK